MTVSFCARVWERVAPLRRAIDALPFITELADGSLERDRFTFYLAQDSRYLLDYARALAAAASLAGSAEDIEFFAHSAAGVMVVERGLHGRYFADFGLDAEGVAAIPASPACAGYVDHLLAVARGGTLPVLVAALLPCFWIYEEVGNAVLGAQSAYPDNPYRAWIETYADEEFAASCATARGITDRLAADASESTRERMAEVFVRSTEYEWMFWDSAYRREQWPTVSWR